MTKQPDRVSAFQPQFREDLAYWVRTDRKTALRLLRIVEEVLRNLVSDDRIDFLQGRFHY